MPDTATPPTSGGVTDTISGAADRCSNNDSSTDDVQCGDAQMATMYADLLWGGDTGWAALALGDNPHYENGKYKHSQFSQRFYRWPDDRPRLIADAIANAPKADVYVAPMLRADRCRAKGNGIGGRYIWCDVDDDWTPDHQAKLDTIWTTGSFVVLSGTEGHRHLYLTLGVHVDIDTVTTLNKRLAKHLGGDAKWSDESLLRLPGTFNHKCLFDTLRVVLT